MHGNEAEVVLVANLHGQTFRRDNNLWVLGSLGMSTVHEDMPVSHAGKFASARLNRWNGEHVQLLSNWMDYSIGLLDWGSSD